MRNLKNFVGKLLMRFETSMTKKLTDFELDLKIENGKQLIFLQAHNRVVNGEI